MRAGQWALLDVEHIAEEIEDMNISHRHQLAANFTDLPKDREWVFGLVLKEGYLPS
ncbi:DUF29 family protein [Duganella sp. FT135W]|uniref:DUF29 family protein n=1 Tax=Duganella flavida TaxID=2692175 RepID=A0A6L8KAF0_9BURK|nr:DUF29 family protein [Duganella flavida]